MLHIVLKTEISVGNIHLSWIRSVKYIYASVLTFIMKFCKITGRAVIRIRGVESYVPTTAYLP